MALALRQIALVATRLAPVEHALTTVFDLTPCHRDPAVAQYGLENVLLPIGRQFLEVVAPTRAETAAERFLARRGGDGGYMVITQCADHDAYRARVAALGVRIAHEFQAEGFRNMQLHPRDTGGSFFEIDQQLGDAEDWLPAGEHWRDTPASTRVSAIAAAEIQADAPRAVAERWAAIADAPLNATADGAEVALADARLRFVHARDGRPEGLAGLDLVAIDAQAILAAARAAGARMDAAGFLLAGMRWRLV